MRNSKKIILAFILFSCLLPLAFQSCSADNFETFGNGDPHEGVSIDNNIEPIENNNPPAPAPGGQIAYGSDEDEDKALKFIPRFRCPIAKPRHIRRLTLGYDSSGKPVLIVGAVRLNAYRFPWNNGPGKRITDIYKPISSDVLVEVVKFNKENFVAHVRYIVTGGGRIVERIPCHKLKK